jgi:lipid II:glycine glycyltransferase (peptidoglycan interpeptide bridge formation enzyme)
MQELSSSEWDTLLGAHPKHHILQSAAWGELKAQFGWLPVRVATPTAGAQILFRKLPGGFSMAYLPKGPVGEDKDTVWPFVENACRKRGAIFLKVEPDEWESPLGVRPPPGFHRSPQTIQPPRTIVIDLRDDEECLLGRMKQKTRYNLKLAQKKGVLVRPFADLNIFHRLMQTTSARDTFGVHSLGYYRRAYEIFAARGACELLAAEYEGEILAAVMIFCQGKRAWYFYGGSSDAHRDLMPNYLLQWEAMRWARAQGCTEYDLWGVPDEEETVLEAGFNTRSDGLWGVYRFKRGFGGQLRRAAGPWDCAYKPVLYRMYQLMLRFKRG